MKKQKTGTLRIGTSGIVVPGNKQSFPAEFQLRSRLNYYGSLFNTLEVNSTFQKIPMPPTLEKWALDVPEAFRFTVKLWREITHVKQLHINLQHIDQFFDAVNHLGEKKGCLLVQFPGRITAEFITPVEQILQRLQKLDRDNQWQKAVEFRSVTWYNNQAFALLDKYDASLVLHDMPKSKSSAYNESAKFVYSRFHGPKGDYRGNYSDDFLREHAEKMQAWLSAGKDVYAYFNNTMGNAFENATCLKEMIEKHSSA